LYGGRRYMENVRKAVHQVRSLDVRIILIVLLIAVSTGHVGRMFADREDARQTFIGYLLAVSIDGVLAISLYEVANVQKRSHRAFALVVFLVACTISGGFNVWYYRQNYPADPLEVSILLGATAPTLAACLSIMKAMGDAQRTQARQVEREAEGELEWEKYRIDQEEQTRRLKIEQTERTKRERVKAHTETTKPKASTRDNGRGNGRLSPGQLDDQVRLILQEKPDIGPRPLARELDISPSTASGILKRLRDVPQQ